MEQLTNQEKRITHLVANGFIEKEIADILCISPVTVSTHTRNIRRKICAKNIADITRKYILSLSNPKDVLKAVFFLMIQLHIVFNMSTIDLRNPKPVRTQTSRIVRKAKD